MTEQGAMASLSNSHLRRRHAFSFSRRVSPELCFVTPPSYPRGRREGRVPAAPAVRCAKSTRREDRIAAYR
ncbi:hypothetical protein EAS62_38475 [Bradyrhizobium zhanjiangense]|uniref:Uncharacterized protein n=1 Tax=Bradyrhizobium zhanjiangense TaxID=1325107 RepID=A0ABY0D8Q7_9BRAD|nr:hypothetical protein EAS62_38475 [Bradyrhizobium zhanjiangense]